MILSSGDIYRVYRPSGCELRLYLHHQQLAAAEPGPFEEVIRKLGERHEKNYLLTLNHVTDLSSGTSADRQRLTLQAITNRALVIYQPLLGTTMRLGDRHCELMGAPDFLIREGDDYVIRDVKIARRITEKDHVEILRQLQFYGWLYELVIGKTPKRLEVYGGTKEIATIGPAAQGAIQAELSHYLDVINERTSPYEPVGWTKCSGCGYVDRCWKEAEDRHDVALVLKVDQSLARSLRDIGVGSYDQLLRNFDEPKLSEFRKQHGNKSQKVGKAAPDILLSARALQTQKTIPIARPQIPPGTNFVMFDLEGLPPHLDELEKIYLWGVKVFGERPSVFMAATAGFGVEGDRAGWEHFLKNVRQVIDDYGHIPFVHWHHYERTKLNMYIDRYGDPDGLASIVRDNLFNLLPATQNSVMLPLPSYSLKVVESYVGFKRSQKDYGGDWAMAKYIEATEMKDREGRDKVVAEILKYNEEDLAATWAVFCWVRDYGQHMNATARQD